MPNAVLERTSRELKRPNSQVKGSASALLLASAPIVLLAALPILISRIGDDSQLAKTFWFVSAALLVFLMVLRWNVIRSGRTLRYEIVANRVHYVQLTMHTCVYTYWGLYWPEVGRHVPLILAQILFAYAFDMLVSWSRRDCWILGFGPFPIVLSTNLFLWFHDDWFYLQFLLIATGVLGKEFLKWKREGRLVHIFNPSALSLFLFSVVLIATNSTGMTWGIEIADTLHRPPHIYLEIFLLGLVVQSLFRVTLVTLFSAAALWVLNLLYTSIAGDYNFIDSNIPVAVFLGLHLLVTDPATSPRTNFGKIVFGFMYGAGVFGMYRLLVTIGAPEFYDKLLCVPLLNLTVRGLDSAGRCIAGRLDQLRSPFLHVWRGWSPQRVNAAWMSVWILFFGIMFSTGFLAKGKDHPGSDPSRWKRACESGKHQDCEVWLRILNAQCESNSREACFTLARILQTGEPLPRDGARAGIAFGKACDLGLPAGCSSLVEMVQGAGKDDLLSACHKGDGASCFLLGSLSSGGNGVPQNGATAIQLFEKSCDLGWWRGCGRLGISYLVGQGTEVDVSKALVNFEKGCKGRNGASCFEAAKLYADASSGFEDHSLARRRLRDACAFEVKEACRALVTIGASRP